MLKPSKEELKKHKAYYKTDTDFTAYARLLQSKCRERKNYPIGRSMTIDKNGAKPYGNYYGNYVDEMFANQNGCNFLTSKIWNIAQKEMEKAKTDNRRKKHSGALYDEYRFICNLLTSQSMCFNLFGEFLDRKNSLCKILNEIKPNLMDKESQEKAEFNFRRHQQYKEITEKCGLFKKEIIDIIRKLRFSQIWRDHLLSISLKTGELIKKILSIDLK